MKLAIMLLIINVFVGCSDKSKDIKIINNDEIVGKWKDDKGKTIEFLKENNFIGSYGITYKYEWLDQKHLKLNTGQGETGLTYEVKVENDTLTVTDSSGIRVYKKQ